MVLSQLTLKQVKAVKMKTYLAKKDELKKEHYVIDAEGKVLGRIATRVATILCGKHKPTYTPHVDTGDFVDVLNVDKVRVTGKKATEKMVDARAVQSVGLSVALEELAKASSKRKVYDGYVDAIKTKRDMLISLGAHMRKEREAEPMIRDR